MEPTGTLAPPVVAVMVVHEPGPWFQEVLAGLAAQDHPNLKCLFLVSGEAGTLPAMIRERVPNAFVRGVAGNPGFGAAANEVMRLVDGDNGFFCFLHDDVALDPSAIRLLVEEVYRSNAGIVGPKLVDWDHPVVLQHVGLAVDRLGEVDPLVEPGEVDQEQHDAVRDVFAVPSACLMIRADLFRAIGGFDPAIEYHGDDVDLCWRAHLSGARVVVVPAARGRHREGLAARRPDVRHATQAVRNRMRTVLSLTGGRRLALVVPQLVLVTVAEVVVTALMGRIRQAGAALAALGGMVLRLPGVFARRRQVAPLRHVPDTEVAGLQLRGSARLVAFLRGRGARAADPDATNERRWRETAGSAPVLAWLAVLLLFIIGSRKLIAGGVPNFGEFLAFPDSPSRLLSSYMSGWNGHGLGSADPTPTGIALVAVASIGTLFHMQLLHTVSILGLVLAGYLGAYRLGSALPSVRARITLFVVYAAVPLPSQLLSAGRWSALVVYAATPWAVHILRRLAGIDSFAAAPADDTDGVVEVVGRRAVRLFAQLALLAAVALAFAPAFALVLVGVGLAMAVATAAAGSSLRAAAVLAVAPLAAVVAAIVANLPWSATLFGSDGWTSIVGVPEVTARSLGATTLARFALGLGSLTPVAVALYLPVIAAPLVARSWRFTWALRAAALVFAFGALAILDDRAALPFRMPEPGVLLVPVALGIALAAGCLAAAFEADVLRGSFGWRQPLGVLAAAAIVIGLVPGVAAVGGGRWNTPERTLHGVYVEFAADPAEGDYRVLWVGDPAALPVAGWTLQPGIGFAITDDGPLEVQEHWSGQPTAAEQNVARALRQMAAGVTLRGGRLLAQYGIRYVIIPVADGFNGTIEHPRPVPAGLDEVLDDQLDLASPLLGPPNYLVYENTAYAPVRATLTASGADASLLAGDEAGVSADLRGSVPFAIGAQDIGPAGGQVEAGTLHVAVPYDPAWTLTVDGQSVAARRAFGVTMAYDVPAGGDATLEYDTPLTRSLWLLAQLVVWLGLALAATRFQPSVFLRRRRADTALLDTAQVADLSAPYALPEADDLPWGATGDPGLTRADDEFEIMAGDDLGAESAAASPATSSDGPAPASAAVGEEPADGEEGRS
ncbi:MAG: glycosyltransferase [Ilumatobacteraceae bacterium]|nr:glycosyltransferase [Ilumatobacter sp.]